MKRRTFLFLSALGLQPLSFKATFASLMGSQGPTTKSSDLRLWYRQPAAGWNEALPIGNGRLAAMVFGGIETERIQLNEETIWAGEKRDRTTRKARVRSKSI